jgi:hypothetical protein
VLTNIRNLPLAWQEIVHLAIAEPGQNCVNETFNDMDFPIPATWSKEVPRSGIFTCYYCREQVFFSKYPFISLCWVCLLTFPLQCAR